MHIFDVSDMCLLAYVFTRKGEEKPGQRVASYGEFALFYSYMNSQRGDGMLEVEHIELDHRAWAALQTLHDIYYIWQGNGRNGIIYYLCHSP